MNVFDENGRMRPEARVMDEIYAYEGERIAEASSDLRQYTDKSPEELEIELVERHKKLFSCIGDVVLQRAS